MRISRQYAGLGAFLFASMFIAVTQKACDDSCREKYQQKIEQADSNRYKRLMSLPNNKNSGLWQREYYKMQDSLRVDSFYKAGYTAGQKSVRDSLRKTAH